MRIRVLQPLELVHHAIAEAAAQSAGAITSISAVDATTRQLIAMPAGAIAFGSALHATAAVAGAQLARGNPCALVVFVALVTDTASLVAAVSGRRAIEVFVASLQAAARQRVAREASRAITGDQARHAEVPSRVTQR